MPNKAQKGPPKKKPHSFIIRFFAIFQKIIIFPPKSLKNFLFSPKIRTLPAKNPPKNAKNLRFFHNPPIRFNAFFKTNIEYAASLLQRPDEGCVLSRTPLFTSPRRIGAL